MGTCRSRTLIGVTATRSLLWLPVTAEYSTLQERRSQRGGVMAGDLTVLDGNTFFVSDAAGDVEPGQDANGFFHADMRHLSTWRLLVNGRPMHVLTSRTVDYYSAAVFGTLATVSVGENPSLSIRRDRFVAGGIHEDLT